MEVIEHIIKEYTLMGVHILELFGTTIILFASVKYFICYFTRKNCKYMLLRSQMAKSLAFGLEFKLGGEILRTVIVGTIREVGILAAIIVLRGVLNLIIHWELEREEKYEG